MEEVKVVIDKVNYPEEIGEDSEGIETLLDLGALGFKHAYTADDGNSYIVTTVPVPQEVIEEIHRWMYPENDDEEFEEGMTRLTHDKKYEITFYK